MKLILISVIVGAIIGLFTNWLAIVMLFRPHREVRLFGMRLPFTPGLIPSRQADIADKLGEVVENDLLTPEGLARSLKRPTVEYAVKRAAVRAIGDTLNEAPTIGALTKRLFGERAQEAAERWASERAAAFLRSDEAKDKLAGLADSLFEHLQGTLSSEDVRRELARGFAHPLHANLASGALTWQEALPEGVRGYIEERLRAQVRPVLKGAAEWLEEPAVVAAISVMLQEKVENIPLIGSMAKGFLTPDRVASDIVPRLQAAFASEKTSELMTAKLGSTIRDFWSKPVGNMLGELSADDLTSLLDKVIAILLDRALAENTSSREMFRSFLVNGITAGANEKTIGDLVRRLMEALAGFDVRSVYIKHTDDVDRYVAKGWRYLQGHLIDAMPELLDALAIREVVREQIKSFPIPTLEKLILSVVNKELKMITYLGGILGAVIGLIQAFLASL